MGVLVTIIAGLGTWWGLATLLLAVLIALVLSPKPALKREPCPVPADETQEDEDKAARVRLTVGGTQLSLYITPSMTSSSNCNTSACLLLACDCHHVL